MTDKMKGAYNKLDTNEKRNELSSLLIKMEHLINEILKENNVDISVLESVENYDSVKNSDYTEDESLLFFYDNVWKLKNKILNVVSAKEDR